MPEVEQRSSCRSSCRRSCNAPRPARVAPRREGARLRKPVTLIAGQFGSPHYGTRPYLEAAMQLTRKAAPRALYLGVASRDDASFGTALCALLGAAGAVDVFWPKLAKRRRNEPVARKALARVDFVFVGGGDVEAGMNVLRRAQLIT